MIRAEDIVKNLYEGFVQERSGDEFSDESNNLPPELRGKFQARIHLYREAMLLLALIAESKIRPELEPVLQLCERYVFGADPTKAASDKLNAIKAGMSRLAHLLNPGNPRQLTWGVEWFLEMGHTAVNPVHLTLFVTAWMDDYIALVKTIRELREG